MILSLRYQTMAFCLLIFPKANGTGEFETWMSEIQDWLTKFQKETKVKEFPEAQCQDSASTNSDLVEKCGSIGPDSDGNSSGPASARVSPEFKSAPANEVLSDVSDPASDGSNERRRRSFTEPRRRFCVPPTKPTDRRKSPEPVVQQCPKFYEVVQHVLDTSENWDDQERAERLRNGVYTPSKYLEMTKELLSYTSRLYTSHLWNLLDKTGFQPFVFSRHSQKADLHSIEQKILSTFAKANDEQLVERAEKLLEIFDLLKDRGQTPTKEDTDGLLEIQRQVQLVMLTRIDGLATLLEKMHEDDPEFSPKSQTLLMTVAKMKFLGERHFLVPLNTRLMLAAQHYVCGSWNDDS